MKESLTRRTTLGILAGGLTSFDAAGKTATGVVQDALAEQANAAKIQAEADAIRSGRQPGGITLPNGELQGSAPITLKGDYHGGISLDAQGTTLVNQRGTAILLGDLTRPGPEYRLNARISGVNLAGSRKWASDTAGVRIEDTADVLLRDGIYSGFNYAIRSVGGLIWDAYNLTLRDSGYGLHATETSTFAPNSINLYSTRIIKNDLAVYTGNNPSGVINFWGGEIEDNNNGGSDKDGKKIVHHDNAGSINYFGNHFESNPGQYNLYYTGASEAKNLLMLGCQVIAGAAEQVHVERGRGTFVASRITSGGKRGIVFGADASGSVIDCEADLSGPGLSNVISLRSGRLAFGWNPVAGDPLVHATPAAIQAARNIVAQWQNDTVQLRFRNAAGAISGYIQASLNDHTLHNSNSKGGWAIAAGNQTVLRVGRGGMQAIEGNGPNTTHCGTASAPWAGGYTQTAFKVTSDRRAKRDIRPLEERERAVAIRCKGLLRAFRLNAEYQELGEGAVTHYGMIAQDIIEAFAQEGLDALATGIVRHNRWPERAEQRDASGAVTAEAAPAGDLYSVNYEELYALIISTL